MTRMRNRVLNWVFATALATAAAGPAEARSASCSPINQASIEMFFAQWDQALASGDAAQVSSRYAKDALLLPTASEMPRMGRAEIAEYFVEFLKRRPRGVVERRVIFIGCNEAIDAGLYTFMVDGAEPGERVPLRARFSFVYATRDGRWVITHHHSSRMPGEAGRHDYVEPWSTALPLAAPANRPNPDEALAIAWP